MQVGKRFVLRQGRYTSSGWVDVSPPTTSKGTEIGPLPYRIVVFWDLSGTLRIPTFETEGRKLLHRERRGL